MTTLTPSRRPLIKMFDIGQALFMSGDKTELRLSLLKVLDFLASQCSLAAVGSYVKTAVLNVVVFKESGEIS